MRKDELRPFFYMGAAAVGFFGGIVKSITKANAEINGMEAVAGATIAKANVENTTRPFTYLGHEDSALGKTAAYVSRSSRIFMNTAAIMTASSLAGEAVGNSLVRKFK